MRKATRSIHRRTFLARMGAGALWLAAPQVGARSLFGWSAPSERIRLAIAGVGQRGSALLAEFARYDDVSFAAVCDPFLDRRERARRFLEERGERGVRAYADYRDVMARDDIDAVIVSTCDHQHVPVAYAAVTSGKDVYVEKPLSPSLAWNWKLREAVRRHKRIFQYGTQQRSARQFRYAVEVVRNGYLGEIRSVDAWCIDGTRAKEWFNPRSTIPEPLPDGFDYDLWLGPAPVKPYNHWRVHREGSFHTYDYSIGFVAGWGAHPLDIVQWGLKADGTSPVFYEGTAKIPDTGGLFSTIYHWSFRCRYANGVELRFLSHKPAEPVVRKYRKRWSDHGTTFFGSEGWISVDRGGLEASRESLLSIRFASKDERLPVSRGHARNFLDCVRSREEPLSPIEAAVRSDTISHLCDQVVRLGRPLQWDPERERVVGDEEANRRLHRPMRKPYAI